MTATGLILAGAMCVILIYANLPFPMNAILGFCAGWMSLEIGRALEKLGR